MAKPKHSLLSLEAHGTIGDSLTFQKRTGTHFVRKKPVPSDPQTLPQIYHRWDYQDYAALWNALSAADKEAWNIDPDRGKMSGFNYWMKTRLNTLPDLAGRWHLDELSGAIAYDSSKKGRNGTIFGTTPAIGVINGARSFDGIDDKITCGTQVFADVTDEYTIEAFIKTTSAVQDIININNAPIAAYIVNHLTAVNPSKLTHETRDLPGRAYLVVNSTATLDDGLFHYLAAFRKPGTLGVQVDAEITTTPDPRTGAFNMNGEFRIGQKKWYDWFLGIQDEVRVYNRCLSDADRLRHAERRYP